MKRQLLLATSLAVTLVPSAAAHEGGGGKGYTSKVTRITPATPGLTAQVVQGDDQLELVNRSDKTIIVYGYQHEPYLRFDGRHGVDVNMRSPAFTLNLTRYGQVQLPPNADPKAAPKWHRIRSTSVYTWHDHRIHWMSTIDPPTVRNARGQPHHVFDWTVGLRVNDRPAAIHGSLDYTPLPSGRRWWIIGVAAGAVVVGLLITAVLWRRRASRSRAGDAAS